MNAAASQPELTVGVTIEGQGWTAVPHLERLARAALNAAWGAAPATEPGEVGVLFTTDAAVCDLNANFRGIAKPTNVLAFPSDPPYLGDIALADATVLREAHEQGKSPGAHVSHLLVHGMLHLLGHDHHAPSEREQMEAQEIAILGQLGIDDPYVIEDTPPAPGQPGRG